MSKDKKVKPWTKKPISTSTPRSPRKGNSNPAVSPRRTSPPPPPPPPSRPKKS